MTLVRQIGSECGSYAHQLPDPTPNAHGRDYEEENGLSMRKVTSYNDGRQSNRFYSFKTFGVAESDEVFEP